MSRPADLWSPLAILSSPCSCCANYARLKNEGRMSCTRPASAHTRCGMRLWRAGTVPLCQEWQCVCGRHPLCIPRPTFILPTPFYWLLPSPSGVTHTRGRASHPAHATSFDLTRPYCGARFFCCSSFPQPAALLVLRGRGGASARLLPRLFPIMRRFRELDTGARQRRDRSTTTCTCR